VRASAKAKVIARVRTIVRIMVGIKSTFIGLVYAGWGLVLSL
jgi:hypothetical protein